jgi:hypothetical protein
MQQNRITSFLLITLDYHWQVSSIPESVEQFLQISLTFSMGCERLEALLYDVQIYDFMSDISRFMS